MTWKKALLNESATIKDAIKCLDQAAMKIALVVNSELKLTGTISDGDIRRGLLRGLNMDSPIGLVLHGNPFVVNPEINRETVLQLMKANKIQQIPVVDHEGHVLGLHLWDDVCLPKARSNTMIIMAGGKGTRLRPYTENCPKPMLPVAGRPMLEHIIERAVHNGFNHFILAVHYLGHMVEEYFGDGKKFNVSIEYLREQAPLGTAGALSLLEQKPTEPIVVTNGDVLTDLNYAELLDFHLMHQASATMAVRTHEWQHPFGVVQTKGVDITGFEEKPISRTHINAGVYVLDPISLDSLDNACHCDMPTLFERLQLKGLRTVAYPMHEPWLDVGRPADYESAQRSAE
ncbi:nucleotidyltransferase family protein [Limnobacter sp. CACIAM 66H1]|uniref:nucleotidyltransferase family protein n=1 Tax=Limnobacter sp. CACIAM 66H1 TaxID=1813033 RepID=UPI0025C0FC0B|nr:nucleotidyltransferase family protein [Limnobacter sp. CACIAM 66H1]